MKTKKYLWSLLAVLAVSMLSVGLASCSEDDDDDGLGLSEKQVQERLEASSGTWLITEKEDGSTFTMVFNDGYTNGFEERTSWMEPYSVKGDLVYIKKDDASQHLMDVLDGGIRLTKLTKKNMEFYWRYDRSQKYIGVKQQ